MPQHTSLYELKENLARAKERLSLAKKDGLKGKDLQPFTKAVNNAKAAISKAEQVLKDSKKKD